MYNTSESYNSQIRKVIRNYSLMHIQFRLTDPDADADAIVSSSGQTEWSCNPDMLESKQVSARYALLEQNRWLLNGKMRQLPDDAPYDYQGFVGNEISDEEGLITVPTVITIDFAGNPYSFRGLTFQFDTVCDDYPAEIRVLASLKNTTVYDKTFTADSVDFAISEPIPGAEAFADKLVISFVKTSLPYRRIRLEGLILGLRKAFDETSIVSSEWKRTNDLMNTVLPNESMKYTFYDPKQEYNPDNPEGIWEYVESGQQVSFQYGYQLDDGSIEWIPGSTYYVDGSPTVESTSKLSKVTFNTMSRLQSLTDTYDEGVYAPEGKTLYDLAEILLEWANVVDGSGKPLYTLAPSLREYVITAPLPVLSVRELLQLIANAGMCILYTDRAGKIVFEQRRNEGNVFGYTFNDVKTKAPSVKKYPYLKNLIVSVTALSPAQDEEELATVDVVNAKNTEFLLEYDAATELSVKATGGLTINSINGLYAQRAKVVVTGTGTVAVNGVRLSESTYVVQKSCNPVGEDCTIENRLIGNQSHAIEYLEWMAAILKKRNVYTFEDRGFPEVDAADSVTLDTAFTNACDAHITSITIKYGGALSGNVETLS